MSVQRLEKLEGVVSNLGEGVEAAERDREETAKV